MNAPEKEGRPRQETATAASFEEVTPVSIVTDTRAAGNQLKNLKYLPCEGAPPPPPPLEAESLHKRLARLNREHQQTTEALQDLKKEWAARNIRAQQCREAIATPEITFVENKKRELARAIQAIQTEIGTLNRELRAQKAQRQARPRINGSKPSKKAPLKRASGISCLLHLGGRGRAHDAIVRAD